MRPADLQPIGNDLAIKWDNGEESYIPLELLRRACPCATCKGEVDVRGKLHKGSAPRLMPASFELLRIVNVGGYAVQPFWGDGHSSGLYPFDYLRRLGNSSSVA